MVKKKYFEFNKDWNKYTLAQNIPTGHIELGYLYLMLNPYEAEGLDVYIVELLINKTVFIYSENCFKEQAEFDFVTQEQAYAFEDAYIAYRTKREADMPSVELSISDWEVLQQKWAQIKKEQPKYVVFTLDDSGPLDKVQIIGKDELSEEDKEYIKVEHEKYLKYKRARDKYLEHHPDYSEVWRGPQDDEYEADIMKYYED